MQRIFGIPATCILLLCMSPMVVNASTIQFGPTPYLQLGDTPAGFYDAQCPLLIETFEDNSLDSFLTITPGQILPPHSSSGNEGVSTDSVDGDDGVLDGDGRGGYSWFVQDVASAMITFGSTVTSAGLVFTDGDFALTDVTLEAFDAAMNSLGVLNGGDFVDMSYNGETPEDHFLGFRSDGGISKLLISMDAGTGFEIDHIQWQDRAECIPEPATFGSVLMGLVGLAGLRRRRR